MLLLAPVAVLFISLLVVLASGETSDPIALSQGSDYSSTGKIAPLFTPAVRYWENSIGKWAAEWRLDPNLVATVMQIESCGDPQARSHAGAIGLFQVMPHHFQGNEQPYLPATNATRGLAYLRQSLDTYNNPRLALAGYNGGIGTAGRAEVNWPRETVRYAYWGSNIYQDAQNGNSYSRVLNEWLANGGASLCAQANRRLGLAP